MKTVYNLTAWNWRIVRKSWLFVCSIMSIAEIAVLLLAAGGKELLGFSYDIIFLNSGAAFIFIAGYFAAMAVSLRPILQAQGKNKGSYTLHTLPIKRGTVLLSHMLCTAVSLCGIIAWQLVLTAVCYWPTMALSNAATIRAWPTYLPPVGDMQLSYVRNHLVRILLPSSAMGCLTTALFIIAPCVLLVCAFYHREKARFAAICMGVFGAGCCGVLLVFQLRSQKDNDILTVVAILIVLMISAVLWALRSIRRGAWL